MKARMNIGYVISTFPIATFWVDLFIACMVSALSIRATLFMIFSECVSERNILPSYFVMKNYGMLSRGAQKINGDTLSIVRISLTNSIAIPIVVPFFNALKLVA